MAHYYFTVWCDTIADVPREKHLTLWVDTAWCTGCMLCTETAPDIFASGPDTPDSLVRVKQDGQILPAGREGTALLPSGSDSLVEQAKRECPGGGEEIMHVGSFIIQAADSENP